ncbi:MAG: DUF1854 domain-containing protein [Bacteriovoracaceae bacterium]|nr:DUF1854 domain-containing protein [Bacteriovoracaceae bacterium]
MINDGKIFIGNNGQLYVKKQGVNTEVFLKESFPWSAPGKFLSFRDKDDNEVLFVRDLEQLCFCEKEYICKHLERLRFVLDITDVYSIVEEYELRRFDVLTSKGGRTFYTKVDDWPHVRGDGTVMITDVSGDIYKLIDRESLSDAARKKLSYYIE